MTGSDDQERDPRMCSAKNKKTGKPCGNWSLKGGKTCRFHGGSNKRSKEAAKRNLEEQKLRARMQRLGSPVSLDAKDLPQVILNQISAVAALVDWCQARIDELDSDQDVWFGVVKTSEEESAFGTKSIEVREARQHVLLQMQKDARRDVVQFAKVALDANIDERQVRLAEATGAQFETALTALLTAISATPEQMQTAATEIPRILRNLAGGRT